MTGNGDDLAGVATLSDAQISAMSFEQAMDALEKVVTALEGGEAALEDSIALYERGEKLRRRCEDRLKEAEMRVEKITRDGAAAEPFDPAAAPESAQVGAARAPRSAKPAPARAGSDGDIPF